MPLHHSVRNCLGLVCLLPLLMSGAGCLPAASEGAASVGGSRPVTPPSQMRAEGDALRHEIDEALKLISSRHLDVKTNAAWQIVHGVLGVNRDLLIEHDGKLVPALDYLLEGGEAQGWELRPGSHGLDTVVDPGSKTGQGHEDQWIGYLSLLNLPPDRPVIERRSGRTYKVIDLATQAQWDIRDGMEATWTLMALATYLPADAKWQASDGAQWTLERVAGMEADQSLGESACGGSHRLVGLVVARDRHLSAGGTLTGQWADVDHKIRDAADTARMYQQPSGSFSTNYFERPGNSPDVGLQISTTGHTLEFLTYALNDEDLKGAWVARAVARLCALLRQTQDMPLECGGLYHTAHGLLLYRERRFGKL